VNGPPVGSRWRNPRACQLCAVGPSGRKGVRHAFQVVGPPNADGTVPVRELDPQPPVGVAEPFGQRERLDLATSPSWNGSYEALR